VRSTEKLRETPPHAQRRSAAAKQKKIAIPAESNNIKTASA